MITITGNYWSTITTSNWYIYFIVIHFLKILDYQIALFDIKYYWSLGFTPYCIAFFVYRICYAAYILQLSYKYNLVVILGY